MGGELRARGRGRRWRLASAQRAHSLSQSLSTAPPMSQPLPRLRRAASSVFIPPPLTTEVAAAVNALLGRRVLFSARLTVRSR